MSLKRLFVTATTVVLLMSTCLMYGVSANTYTCYPNGTISFTNPNSAKYLAAIASYNNGTDELACSTSGTDFVLISDCDLTYNVTVTFSDRPDASDLIAGGSDILTFRVKCNDIENNTVTEITAEAGVTVPHSTLGSIIPTFDIVSEIYDENSAETGTVINEATLGEEVYYIITGPVEYWLKPVTCFAHDDPVRSSSTHVVTLITNGCSEDKKLVEDFTRTNLTRHFEYVLTMHAFKFYNTDKLYLECIVTVYHGSANCAYSCGGGGGRKRRDVMNLPCSGKRWINDSLTSNLGRHLHLVGRIRISGSSGLHDSMRAIFSTMVFGIVCIRLI